MSMADFYRDRELEELARHSAEKNNGGRSKAMTTQMDRDLAQTLEDECCSKPREDRFDVHMAADYIREYREQATASLQERIKFLEECCAENSKFQNKILEIGCAVGDFRRGETVCLNKAIHAIEQQLAAKQAQVDALVEVLKTIEEMAKDRNYTSPKDIERVSARALATHKQKGGE